jgi:hypothetical protein
VRDEGTKPEDILRYHARMIADPELVPVLRERQHEDIMHY